MWTLGCKISLVVWDMRFFKLDRHMRKTNSSKTSCVFSGISQSACTQLLCHLWWHKPAHCFGYIQTMADEKKHGNDSRTWIIDSIIRVLIIQQHKVLIMYIHSFCLRLLQALYSVTEHSLCQILSSVSWMCTCLWWWCFLLLLDATTDWPIS